MVHMNSTKSKANQMLDSNLYKHLYAALGNMKDVTYLSDCFASWHIQFVFLNFSIFSELNMQGICFV